MAPSPTLQELIETVRTDAPGDSALDQLAQASRTVADLEQVSDSLLGHFVDQCRRSGHSWSDISSALGVSRQAAHKRFSPGAPAFDQFTGRARAVLSGAAVEAEGLGYIGTEHLLLALFQDAESLAARILSEVGVTRTQAEEQISLLIPRGLGSATADPPFTPRAVEVLKGAVGEALLLGHNYVGTEHLLLALYRDTDAVASKVLVALGTSYDDVKARVVDHIRAHLAQG